MSSDIKKTILRVLIFPALVLSVVMLGSSCNSSNPRSVIPADAYDYCPLTQQEFNNWFKDNRVTKDGVVKNADSLNFPTDNNNCDFYKWSEQMFLWITSPSPGTSGVFDSGTFYDVSPQDTSKKRTLIPHKPGEFRNFSPVIRQTGPQRLPLIVHPMTGELFEIDSPVLSPKGKQLVKNNKGEDIEIEKVRLEGNKIIFFDKEGNEIVDAKPVFNKDLNTDNLVQQFKVDDKVAYVDAQGTVVDQTEQGQAGGDAVLMAQNGSLVYYTILVNDVYAVFRTMYYDKIKIKFPDSIDELNNIAAYGKKNLGITIKDVNALAIELKMSWVKVEGLKNADRYITTTASIPTYKKISSSQWEQTGTENAKLALVGVHIVGNVAGHPEMLWSTFEHEYNAPMGTYSYINKSNNTVTVPSNSNGDWTFSRSCSAGPFNKIHMSVMFDDGNIDIIAYNPSPPSPPSPPTTISPSNTRRDYPWGVIEGITPNPGVQSAAQSNSQILSINNNVRQLLANGDIRRHYLLVGTTWTQGGEIPTRGYPAGGNEVGTSSLANSTMETYYQGHNCFYCHSSSNRFPKDYLKLSHIYYDILGLGSTSTSSSPK